MLCLVVRCAGVPQCFGQDQRQAQAAQNQQTTVAAQPPGLPKPGLPELDANPKTVKPPAPKEPNLAHILPASPENIADMNELARMIFSRRPGLPSTPEAKPEAIEANPCPGGAGAPCALLSGRAYYRTRGTSRSIRKRGGMRSRHRECFFHRIIDWCDGSGYRRHATLHSCRHVPRVESVDGTGVESPGVRDDNVAQWSAALVCRSREATGTGDIPIFCDVDGNLCAFVLRCEPIAVLRARSRISADLKTGH